ncbi:MAG: protein kinase domain-containing protein [Actinomycetota bacterium]
MGDMRMLGDRYEIRSTLGRGGMATVYEGHDRVLDRPVAIKVLAERYAGDEKFVTRFQREARAAAGLSHPNIVSVFDTGDTDGEHYIVMELVEGETLADVLDREGPLSPERAARICGTVAQALRAAHDQGFVHRDVKPGNVMLSPSGDVKVMDFGIARAATDDTLTQTGTVLGTASYLSPEQSRGDQVDHRSDIYSLGCVLYEMLTGRPPFSGGSPVSVAYKHVNEEPEPASRVNPSVPAELESVVMRALRKDPVARFPTAEAFGEAVSSAVEGETTEPFGGDAAVLPVSTEPLEQPPASRRRWLAPVAIAAILLTTGITTLALMSGEGRDRTRDASRQSEEQTTPAEESPTPTPAATAVDEALFALRVIVQDSVGLLPEDAAEGILEEAEKANQEFMKGELKKAIEHLAIADAVIDASLAEGTTTAETADGLHEAVDLVRQTMLAQAPPTEESPEEEDGEENGDSGPGNSENAPGQIKKGKGD